VSAVSDATGATTGRPPAVPAQPSPAPTLAEVCAAMEQPEMQGLPLLPRDYVLLAVVTVLIPALLILIGMTA
jgi:hypothetical protein